MTDGYVECIYLEAASTPAPTDQPAIPFIRSEPILCPQAEKMLGYDTGIKALCFGCVRTVLKNACI